MRIAVVGPCGSGKSTVVAALRERGFDAYVVSQEHSAVRSLWNHQAPDAVVSLQLDYHTLQRRRGENWPRWLYDLQRERLAEARAHALVEIDTGQAGVVQTVGIIVDALASRGLAGDPD